MAKYEVGLLFGGRSGEHEVSIKSAQAILFALENYSSIYSVHPFYIDPIGLWHDESLSRKVLETGEPVPSTKKIPLRELWHFPKSASTMDVWFPALHGPYGEDGTIQGLLKLLGRPFVGASVLGSAVGMDKLLMKLAFAHAGLPQLPYLEVDVRHVRDNKQWDSDLISKIENRLGYPCFIKPANLGSSVGISRAKNKQELISALDLAAQHDRRLVVEQGSKSRFRELECGILGNIRPQASPVGEMLYSEEYEFFDFTAKYTEGKQHFVIPAEIPPDIAKQVQDMAIRAFQVIDCHGLARVDFFYSDIDNQVFINEINTIPGLTAFSMYPSLWKAAGVDFPDLVHQLLKLAIEFHQQEPGNR